MTSQNLVLGAVCKQVLLISKDNTHHYYKTHDLLNELFSDHQKLVISNIWEILLECFLQLEDNESHTNIHKILVIRFAHLIKGLPNQISFWIEFCFCIWCRVYEISFWYYNGLTLSFWPMKRPVITIFFIERRNVTHNLLNRTS